MLRYCILSMLLLSSATLAQAQKNQLFVLPSTEAIAAIKQLKVTTVEPGTFTGLAINKDGVPPWSTTSSLPDGATVPFINLNAMLLQLDPNITKDQLDALISEKNLLVTDTFPELGTIQVQTDISKFVVPDVNDNSINDSISKGALEAMAHFEKDNRIVNAVPDTLLTDQSVNFVVPTDVTTSLARTGTEYSDWGNMDIEAEALWSLPGASDGAIFGVLDDGFARHEDIAFSKFSGDNADNSHGNHVSGIACARHNSLGVRGVLPNCFVRAKKQKFFPTTTQGGAIQQFVTSFAKIVGEALRFVTSDEDVGTFNISLGYNWNPNFGIDIDDPNQILWRAQVEGHGQIAGALLLQAKESGKAIFSAAGNDSLLGQPGRNARYASPFNWAAIVGRENQQTDAGVVVEAHDPQGNRGWFSNVGGQISCPGTDIMSTIAFDAAKAPSTTAYGKLSGTSMASPYCAAAHTLLGLVRPGYTSGELTNCLLTSTAKTDTGTPMLKLTQALAACPPK
jgi:hypothetical protein